MRTSRVAQDTAKIMEAISRGRSLRSRTVTADVNSPTPRSIESRKRKRDEGGLSVNDGAASSFKRESPNEVARSSRARKARRQPAKRVVDEDGEIKMEPPPTWERVYALTQEMRKRVLAPVDTMGCESLAQPEKSPRDQRLQTLTALMLSSQTKDTVTAAAIKNLQENLPGGLNLESLLAVEPYTLNELIGKVGFHNLKTKYIKATAEILRDKYDSDIPDSIEGLISLPGVGPKMAYLCMSGAWGRDEGIGVDVHVHRITNLWGWHKTNQPEETRLALQSWLPKEKWHDINHLLVGLGQTICLPVGRKCGECTLAQEGLCPGAVVSKLTSVVKSPKAEIKIESAAEPIPRTLMDAKTGTIKQEIEIKAEDCEPATMLDIEDIGRNRPRRNRQS